LEIWRNDLRKFTLEAKVGLFVFLAFVIIGFITLKLGDYSFFKQKSRISYVVKLSTAAGLANNADVFVSGVLKGKVSSIDLSDGTVYLDVLVDKDASIRKDAQVQVKSQGLIGEGYLEFVPLSKSAPLAESGFMFDGSSGSSIANLQDNMSGLFQKLSSVADDVKAVSSNLRSALGTTEGEVKIKNIVDNIEKITSNLNVIILENRQNLKGTIENANKITTNLNSDLPQLLDKFETFLTDLRELVSQNKSNINSSMSNIKEITDKANKAMDSIGNIATKIDTGKGTMGKLINEDSIHDNLNTSLVELKDTLKGLKDYFGRIQKTKLFLEYKGEYLTSIAKTKSYVSLKLQPNPNKFYLASFISDPYKNLDLEDRNETITTNFYDENNKWIDREKVVIESREETKKDSLKFSLQYGYTIQDMITMRAGLFESKGGVGIDLTYKPIRTQLSFDAWDFGNDDYDPHLKLTTIFKVYKRLYLSVGYDDFLNPSKDDFFFGGGISLEDDDLKYLLGQLPIPGLK
jgi:phospholipid/cholesterol/gamma-HCH transport system substrate-binding protein